MIGRSLVMVDKGRVELQGCKVEEPGQSQVLVRAEKTLISPGTERAILLVLPDFSPNFPKRTGYCFVGTVEKAGEAVTEFQAGDRICGPLHHQEYQVTDTERLARVPEGVSSEQATFGLLLQTAMQAVRKARLEIGTGVLVLGLGLVGQLAAGELPPAYWRCSSRCNDAEDRSRPSQMSPHHTTDRFPGASGKPAALRLLRAFLRASSWIGCMCKEGSF